jgi:hypothetical protein
VGTHLRRSTRGGLFALLCLLVCAGAGFEWWRSQTNFTSLRWRGFAAMTAEGKMCLLHSNTPTTDPERNGLHTVPYSRTGRNATIVQWPNFGFSWPTDPASGERKLTVVSPLWFVAGLFALHPLWWVTRGKQAAALADEME